MQENEGEAKQEVEALETEVTALEAETDETKETTDWKAKYEETAGQLKRAQTKLEKSKIEKKVEEKLQTKTGELDENALDFLDLKGITESEDVKVIETIVKKTGMTVRQALKDEYVVNKLTTNKANREVKDATPSNNKRSGAGGGNDLAVALAEYKASGLTKLPADFALRTQVINATIAEKDRNRPSWKD